MKFNGKQSRIQIKISSVFNDFLEAQKTGLAFIKLRCSFGEAAIVPDVVVLQSSRIPRDEDRDIADRVETAPDLIVEILSPGQSPTKVLKSISHCLDYGAQMGWLIDPKEKTILIFQPNKSMEILDAPTAQLPMPEPLSGLSLTVGRVFSWLQV
jgi:Uma2 family endonuclease